MAGWREVCDECSTTLFNYHYMCKVCGYMVCIECSNEFTQMNIDKRKSNLDCLNKDFYLLFKLELKRLVFMLIHTLYQNLFHGIVSANLSITCKSISYYNI